VSWYVQAVFPPRCLWRCSPIHRSGTLRPLPTVTFDDRGRVTKVITPDLAGAPGHVEDTNYSVNANPTATAETDTATGGTGRTITTVVDLLGRTRWYWDGWTKLTSTAYDQVGRPSAVISPLGTQTLTYDATGAGGPTVLDGVTWATPHYDSAGRLSWADYANGTKSDPVTRDALGRETSSLWRKSSDSSVLASDQVALSLAGDVTAEVADGNDPHPGADYTYDGASRLVDAWSTARDQAGTISNRHSAYSFATATGCGTGAQANAGLNSNRSAQTVGDGTQAVTTSYCYDAADRLISRTEAGAGAPVYDGHGNTTGLWGETRSYDASDRHLATTKGSTTVTYLRDSTDRIIQRTSTVPPAAAEVQRYGFTADGDTPDFLMDATGTVTEKDLGLPGGVSVTIAGGAQTWSYPNIHGDVTVTTDAAGTKQGVTRTYDPYGNTTGQPIVDNQTGNYDYGWLGQHQRGLEHDTGLAATIEMGARQYDPTLGRFLETDPIEGGSANDYDYTNADPVNGRDLDGNCGWGNPFKRCGRGHKGRCIFGKSGRRGCRGGSYRKRSAAHAGHWWRRGHHAYSRASPWPTLLWYMGWNTIKHYAKPGPVIIMWHPCDMGYRQFCSHNRGRDTASRRYGRHHRRHHYY